MDFTIAYWILAIIFCIGVIATLLQIARAIDMASKRLVVAIAVKGASDEELEKAVKIILEDEEDE